MNNSLFCLNFILNSSSFEIELFVVVWHITRYTLLFQKNVQYSFNPCVVQYLSI